MRKTIISSGFLALAAFTWWVWPYGAADFEAPGIDRVDDPAAMRQQANEHSRNSPELTTHISESNPNDRRLVESHTEYPGAINASGIGRVEAFEEERLRRLQTEARQADRLDVESVFLAGDSLQGDTAIEVLNANAEEFDAILSELEQQSQMDPLSSEITDVYRNFLNDGPSVDDYGMVMDRLTCGLRICIGESFAGQDHWDRAMSRMRGGSAPPSFAMIEIPVYDASGVLIGRRLMFSTDEQNNSVSIPISYQPPSVPLSGNSEGG